MFQWEWCSRKHSMAQSKLQEHDQNGLLKYLLMVTLLHCKMPEIWTFCHNTPQHILRSLGRQTCHLLQMQESCYVSSLLVLMYLIYIEIAFLHHTSSYIYVIHWQAKYSLGKIDAWQHSENSTSWQKIEFFCIHDCMKNMWYSRKLWEGQDKMKLESSVFETLPPQPLETSDLCGVLSVAKRNHSCW